MTPEELELENQTLKDQVKQLTKNLDEKSPEAIYSVTIDKNGGAMITVRSRPGENGDSFLHRLKTLHDKVTALGFNPKPEPAPKAPATPNAETPPPPQPTKQNTGDEYGTARAVLMKVGTSYTGNKPQLQFECDGMEHPLTFTRPVGDMQKLLAQVGKYTPEQLQVGKKYAVDYLVDWRLGDPTAEGKRYKNIMGVRPGN